VRKIAISSLKKTLGLLSFFLLSLFQKVVSLFSFEHMRILSLTLPPPPFCHPLLSSTSQLSCVYTAPLSNARSRSNREGSSAEFLMSQASPKGLYAWIRSIRNAVSSLSLSLTLFPSWAQTTRHTVLKPLLFEGRQKFAQSDDSSCFASLPHPFV
jgi:hypothetical protein